MLLEYLTRQGYYIFVLLLCQTPASIYWFCQSWPSYMLLFGAIAQDKWNQEFSTVAAGLRYTHSLPVCPAERPNCQHLVAAIIYRDSRISGLLTITPCSVKNNSHFWHITTYFNPERVHNGYLHSSCLVYAVDRSANEGRFSYEQVTIRRPCYIVAGDICSTDVRYLFHHYEPNLLRFANADHQNCCIYTLILTLCLPFHLPFHSFICISLVA